jgi:hypothetical protein
MSEMRGSSAGGGTEVGVDLDQVHRILSVMILIFAGGVASFAGVSFFVVSTGAFSPFLGYPEVVRLGIGVFLLFLLAMSYPLSRWSGAANPGESRSDAVARFQTRAVVGAAVRESVGIMGGLLILLAGDVVLGVTAAALAVVTLVTGIPSKDALRAATRGRSG